MSEPQADPVAKKRKVKRRENYHSLVSPVSKIKALVCASNDWEYGMSRASGLLLSSIAFNIMDGLASKAIAMSKGRRITRDVILGATCVVCSDSSIQRHMSAEIVKACTKAVVKGKSGKSRVSSRCGLFIPVHMARKALRRGKRTQISAEAPVALAGAVEYLMSEVIELGIRALKSDLIKTKSGERKERRSTIANCDIIRGIEHDEPLLNILESLGLEYSDGSFMSGPIIGIPKHLKRARA